MFGSAPSVVNPLEDPVLMHNQIYNARALAAGDDNPCGSFFTSVDGITSLYFLYVMIFFASVVLYFHKGKSALIPHSSKMYILGTLIGFCHASFGRTDSILYESVRIWRDIDPSIILFALLPVILFQVMMNVNAHVFGRSAFQLLYLGVFFVAAMIVCIGAISLVANTYSFHLVTIWILATSLGFSDPVATEALSLNLELSQKLKALLIGESQLGVVTAFIIFKALLKIRTGENNGSDGAFWGAYAVREPLLSIGVGIVTGTVAVLILQETSDRTSSSAMMIQVSTLAVLSFGPFLIAEYFLESCGLMTTVVVGYMVASFGWPLFASRTLIKHMRILIAFVVSNIMFIQTGLVIGSSIHAAIDGASPYGATEVGYVFAIYATLLLARVLLLVLMRPTLNSVGKYDFSFSEGFVLSWSGMPGSPSMMFMLLLREEIENQLEAT